MMTALLMSACANGVPSATNERTCAELRADLPTASVNDTEQSKKELADFLETFAAIC